MAEFLFKLYNLLAQALDLYWLLIMVRLLGSWIPGLDWYRQPLRFIVTVTEPVLARARSIIPPFGMMDLSPIAVFLLLQLCKPALKFIFAGLIQLVGS
jgi:YggT family protein